MVDPKLIAQLMTHEGCRLTVYDDATGLPLREGHTILGNPTIGVGRNLASRGLSSSEAMLLLTNDIAEWERDLHKLFPRFASFRSARQHALIDMRHNLGGDGLRGFTQMVAAINAGDWQTAAKEALDSRWADQVGDRAITIAKMLRDGGRA